ncbi:MAG: hypothetical protein QOG03_269 [Actinomycetota bacterium]|jgi:hypothetical protein|nr:hypothetical protein [Actinomycetota bacterium]
MTIRTKLTVRDDESSNSGASASAQPATKRQPTEEERAKRKERVVAAKDALARSVGLRGEQVAPGRAALKLYLQRLNEPNQPDDALFKALLEAPFTVPPKRKERR